jgi:hypothetical protein
MLPTPVSSAADGISLYTSMAQAAAARARTALLEGDLLRTCELLTEAFTFSPQLPEAWDLLRHCVERLEDAGSDTELVLTELRVLQAIEDSANRLRPSILVDLVAKTRLIFHGAQQVATQPASSGDLRAYRRQLEGELALERARQSLDDQQPERAVEHARQAYMLLPSSYEAYSILSSSDPVFEDNLYANAMR